MQYLEGPPPDPPLPEDLGMILFFSSVSATVFIVLS
jgi:hypothetical protein